MNGINLEERAEKVLALAKAVTDKAEVYLGHNNLLTIRMANSKVIESKGILDTGVGVRLILEGGIGFSSTCDLSDKGLKSVVDETEAMAHCRKIGFEYDFPFPKKAKEIPIFDKYTSNLIEDLDSATDYAHRMIEACLESSPKVVESAGTVNFLEFKKLILNTNGIDIFEKGTGWSAFLTGTAQKGLDRREGMWTRSGIKASDFNPELIGKKAGEMAIQGLGGVKIKEGDYELILPPTSAESIMRDLAKCTNPIVQQGNVPYMIPLLKDRLGEKISSSLLSLRMNPRDLGFFSVGAYDDEGVPTQELTLFEKGVYKASPYDTWYAQKEDVESTGSGFRGLVRIRGGTMYPGKMYHTEPAPGTVGLEMDSGFQNFEEMVESTKKGLIVGKLHYLSIILPTRGDYTGLARMGTTLVKNGEIVGAVQKCRLMDNILNLVNRIEMVGKPVKIGTSAISPIKISKAHFMPYSE